jgi:uncharacterized ferredoxin-like protein
MVKYLGELEDDDVVMFVIEHLKDHKSPAKLVEGLEPVRVIQKIFLVCSEATRFVGSGRGSCGVYDCRVAASHF